jgi:CBS domain-containing protein
MGTTTQSLLAMTADDLMTRTVVRLTEEMPLREVAALMHKDQVSGAPVVDRDGRCVGVLSATDFLRLAEKRAGVSNPASPPRPITCPFQASSPNAEDITLCNLPPGVCALQRTRKGPGGEEQLVCTEPHSVPVDWQMVEVEKLPADQVRNFMTPNPVTVRPTTSLRGLARMMIDAHIHRVIVVDEERRPVGIVSSTDVLAAVAYAEDEP